MYFVYIYKVHALTRVLPRLIKNKIIRVVYVYKEYALKRVLPRLLPPRGGHTCATRVPHMRHTYAIQGLGFRV